MRGTRIAFAVAIATAFASGTARADDLAVAADEVTVDAREGTVEARGLRVEQRPFFVTSPHARIQRTPRGLILEGEGRLGFCPCLGTPLGLAFSGGRFGPPDDAILYGARLELFGIPVFWLPVLWLRSAARPGLLPPEIALRGADGLFLGAGFHVPWASGDRAQSLDTKAGAYVLGGVAVDTKLTTKSSTTRVRWDRLRGDDGVLLDARGFSGVAAWDVDALRGARAVRATTDLSIAAQPFDRAALGAAFRQSGWTFASAVRGVATRGEVLGDVGSAGPVLTLHKGDALGAHGDYDLTLEGGALSGPSRATMTFVRGEGNAELVSIWGPMESTLSLRGVADALALPTLPTLPAERALGAAGALRGEVGIPLERASEVANHEAPWVHRITPRIAASLLGAHTEGRRPFVMGRGPGLLDGSGVVASGGVMSGYARWGSARGLWASLDIGVLGNLGQPRAASPLARMRVDTSWGFAAASLEAGVLASGDSRGGVFLARGRLGPEEGLSLRAVFAHRGGVDPIAARFMTEGAYEPASGFLSREGDTGGARVALPLGPVKLGFGADIDFQKPSIVGATGALEFADSCRCLNVRAQVSQRIGREGIDAWITVDLARIRRVPE